MENAKSISRHLEAPSSAPSPFLNAEYTIILRNLKMNSSASSVKLKLARMPAKVSNFNSSAVFAFMRGKYCTFIIIR